MLLQHKNAIIYGAGGSLGGAVARALANEGANVFLTARTEAQLNEIAEEIHSAGGFAETDVVDALDRDAIGLHLEKVRKAKGSVDISFNATGRNVVQNIPLIQMSAGDFMAPINFMLETQFLTMTEAGKIMAQQRAGTIISLTATPGGIGYPYTGGFAPACCGIECLVRNLASELGVYGVRVVNMRSGGSPDSKVFKQAIESHPELMAIVMKSMEEDTMLKKMPLMADIANLAVFLCSQKASMITGVTVDVTAGTSSGLNYRAKS